MISIGSAPGFSTHDATLARSLSNGAVPVGASVTVSVRFRHTEPDVLRGFYYSDQIPSALIVDPVGVKVDGVSVDCTLEVGGSDDVYSGATSYRWILEAPGFVQDNRINSNSVVEIVYQVTSAEVNGTDLSTF